MVAGVLDWTNLVDACHHRDSLDRPRPPGQGGGRGGVGRPTAAAFTPQKKQMAQALHALLESGILLTAVALNIFFNGAKGDASATIDPAMAAEVH